MTFDLTAIAQEATVGGLQMPLWILWLLAIAMVVGAGHTIYTKAYKPLVGIAKKIHSTYEHVMEYDHRLNEVEKNTRQLTRNSGTHLADAVYRIEEGQRVNAHNLREHTDWSNEQFVKVWQGIASRDITAAAHEAAKAIEEGENGS